MAPVTLRKGIEELIHREIKNANKGKTAMIKAKMNSLVDPNIIDLLYEASQRGVKIELIIRGMCCLYPGKEGLSENITVISIIGNFLEHSILSCIVLCDLFNVPALNPIGQTSTACASVIYIIIILNLLLG